MCVDRDTKALLPPLLMLSALCCFAQAPGGKDFDPAKAFEATVSYSQSLTEWALLIFGGSVVIVVGTSYVRPRKRWVRSTYFLFMFGWACLGLSMYYGSQVQRVYLAHLWSSEVSLSEARATINKETFMQIKCLKWALGVFGTWLWVYLCWWILQKKEPASGA